MLQPVEGSDEVPACDTLKGCVSTLQDSIYFKSVVTNMGHTPHQRQAILSGTILE